MMIKLKKMVQEQKIWDKKEAAKSEEEAKKLVSQRFHKQIHVFEKKWSERIPTKKVQDYVIETKEEFVLKKGKMYLLLKKERGKMHKFIEEQLRKEYIRPSKSSQIVFVFLWKKRIIRSIQYKTIVI